MLKRKMTFLRVRNIVQPIVKHAGHRNAETENIIVVSACKSQNYNKYCPITTEQYITTRDYILYRINNLEIYTVIVTLLRTTL